MIKNKKVGLWFLLILIVPVAFSSPKDRYVVISEAHVDGLELVLSGDNLCGNSIDLPHVVLGANNQVNVADLVSCVSLGTLQDPQDQLVVSLGSVALGDGTYRVFVNNPLKEKSKKSKKSDPNGQFDFELSSADVDGFEFTVGIVGEQGIEGEVGLQGPAGSQGVQGEIGPEGNVGATGSTGLTGPRGETGAQGDQGNKGDKGDTGAPGGVAFAGMSCPAGQVVTGFTLTGGLICEQYCFDTNCSVDSAGLIAYFPFDGDAVDTVGGNNGILFGNTTFTNGFEGQAVTFDGNGDYVLLNNPILGNMQNWTVTGYVYLEDTNYNNFGSQRHSIFGEYSSVTNADIDNYLIHANDPNIAGLIYDTFPPSAGAVGSSEIMATNLWYAFAYVREGADIRIYVNGVLRGQGTYEPYTGENVTVAAFGSRLQNDTQVYQPGNPTKYAMKGSLDDIKFFNRSLDNTELCTIAGSTICNN